MNRSVKDGTLPRGGHVTHFGDALVRPLHEPSCTQFRPPAAARANLHELCKTVTAGNGKSVILVAPAPSQLCKIASKTGSERCFVGEDPQTQTSPKGSSAARPTRYRRRDTADTPAWNTVVTVMRNSQDSLALLSHGAASAVGLVTRQPGLLPRPSLPPSLNPRRLSHGLHHQNQWNRSHRRCR
jgi:hypothetical protein